ncbi:MAG: hypothetical protein J5748_03995 [Bacteroidales bacterium]|nr:hypothetical protein [Bacteroidales bacterium]
MRRFLILAAALIPILSSCSYKEAIFVQLPDTVWSITTDGTTTWACFHDEENASLLQFNSSLKRYQIDHGTYVTDGHLVTISTEFASDFILNRTFSGLKRSKTNDHFTRLEPYAFPTLAGTVWASPVSNNLHVAYFPSDGECVELLYSNITREETIPEYGWSGAKKDIAGKDFTFYKDVAIMGVYAAQLVCGPLQEEEISSLKGTVWTYNNTGYPADIPSVILFNGKDRFTRISGLWTGNVSSTRVSPLIFETTSGTYSENDGVLTLKIGDTTENCPLSGGSFTLFEKTYSKLDY